MASSFKEGGIYYGLDYIKKNRSKYNFILKQLYPDTYFYNINTDRLNDWITEYSLAEVISSDTITFVVWRLGKGNLPEILDKKWWYGSEKVITKSSGMCYSNLKASDYVYVIKNKPFFLQEFYSLNKIRKTNCEHLTSDGQFFLPELGDGYFMKGYMQSNEESFSGNFSVKLKPGFSFALDTKMQAKSKDYFKATLKAFPVSENVLIVADDMKNGIYKASFNYSKIENGWKTVELNFEVGKNYTGSEINFYVWYQGEDSCYVDDFEITKLEIIH